MSQPKRNLAESPFFAAMGRLGDMTELGLLWLLCSLPLITVGASTAAAFAVADKMAAREDASVRRGFFAAFRRDWRFASRVWLVLAPAGAVIAADYAIGLARSGAAGGALIAAAAVLGLVWLCAFGGGFALLGRFAYTSVPRLLRDGVMLCAANPKAALVWLAAVLCMPALRIVLPSVYAYLRPLWLLFGGGAAIAAFAYAVRPAFVRLENRKR